jgi:hypothetical protein
MVANKEKQRRLNIKIFRNEACEGLGKYLLILAFVLFAATASMNSVARGLNTAFEQACAVLGLYIT